MCIRDRWYQRRVRGEYSTNRRSSEEGKMKKLPVITIIFATCFAVTGFGAAQALDHHEKGDMHDVHKAAMEKAQTKCDAAMKKAEGGSDDDRAKAQAKCDKAIAKAHKKQAKDMGKEHKRHAKDMAKAHKKHAKDMAKEHKKHAKKMKDKAKNCLLYTSDAADDLLCVDLGGRRIIKKKKKPHQY
eukprot:TRINITY_DN2617_c0_g1_i1.p1 TRINITY_DN2617_c0_g1~~TRINITY_DN2617_c0_g1_i1.p1  ORF type:complete len:185 (-),score=87.16 TRINITY_DN2617_c0_g1_i1:65-619(-)